MCIIDSVVAVGPFGLVALFEKSRVGECRTMRVIWTRSCNERKDLRSAYRAKTAEYLGFTIEYGCRYTHWYGTS